MTGLYTCGFSGISEGGTLGPERRHAALAEGPLQLPAPTSGSSAASTELRLQGL